MTDSVKPLSIDPVRTKGYTIADLSRASTPGAGQTAVGPPVSPAVAFQEVTPMPPPQSPAVAAASETRQTPPLISAQPCVTPPQTPKMTVIYILTMAYGRTPPSPTRSGVGITIDVLSVEMLSVHAKSVISLARGPSRYIPYCFRLIGIASPVVRGIGNIFEFRQRLHT
jgi:hypothetical protein